MPKTVEERALALVNEVARERGCTHPSVLLDRAFAENEALCRALEAHDADMRAVSDALRDYFGDRVCDVAQGHLSRFILPKPVDPLVEAMRDACDQQGLATEHTPVELTEHLRKALASRGLEIVEVGDAD